MMLTPALFLLHDRVAARLGGRVRRDNDEIDEQGTVIIAGMGRFGQTVNRMLAGLGHKTMVLDSHPETVDRMRALGIKGFYGDVGRPELMVAAGVADATAVVIAIDDPETAVRMARQISRRHPQVRIIARARDRHHVYALHAAGATESVREVFDGAVEAGNTRSPRSATSDDEIERISRTFSSTTGKCWPSSPSSGTPTFRRRRTPPISPKSASSRRSSRQPFAAAAGLPTHRLPRRAEAGRP